MERREFAPGAYISEVPAEKFKRCKIAIHLVVPGRRENATHMALLPHVLSRRCAEIPDPTRLSRYLYELYGAELSSDSYTAGAARVVALGVSGLKNEYALAEEDLAGAYQDLLCSLLFRPVAENGAFATEDVAIEKEKQAEYLRSEMNDKRGHCLRQARRKLYGDSPLGIESAGYLEDMDGIDEKNLYAAYEELLRCAQVEVQVCGVDVDAVADCVGGFLAAFARTPAPVPRAAPLPLPQTPRRYEEPIPTVQGKLCILLTSGTASDAKQDAVMRLASAVYGSLPTSRLFVNVREKQSLCYYCASSFGYFGGTLCVDLGVDHDKAPHAADAVLKELHALQNSPPGAEELDAAKRYLRSAFSSAKDSPDALMNWSFTEWLKGTNRTMDAALAMMDAVQPDEVQRALSVFRPAVEYVITEKEGA